MRTIHKYELDITDEQVIDLPMYSEMLTIQEQHGKLVLWCAVDTEDEMLPRKFFVVGTGHPMPEPEDPWCALVYCSTVQTRGGKLVWHVFTEMEMW